MLRKGLSMLALTAFLGTAPGLAVQAADVVEQDFQVDDASDLAALCGVGGDSQFAVAAVHFCHGYVVGAYQYYRESIAALGFQPFFCLPDPPPSRNEAVAGFVAWVNADPVRGKAQAVDAMFQYLGETYPCPAKTKSN